MDEKNKFGIPKVTQFGDRPTGDDPGDSSHCSECEAMLADALDANLSAEDQALFDLHMAHCGPCAQLLADAQRGAAWLEMLKSPQPEPPAALLEKILAQTSGAGQAAGNAVSGKYDGVYPPPAMAPGYVGTVPTHGQVIPFGGRFASWSHRSPLGHLLLQPRLTMTAAMAFFSIVLTLDLIGVRLQNLHASDLKPSGLKRAFYSANTHVAQYYEGLRVVYELESRVRDFQSATGSDETGVQAQPQVTPARPLTQPAQPATGEPKQEQQRKPAPNSGSSRRDGANHPLVVAERLTPSELLDACSDGAAATLSCDLYEGRLV